MSLIIPGKTFLVGEYSALVGGSVLGLATGPGFKIDYQSKPKAKVVQDFSMESPAGQLLQDNSSFFENLKIKIQDGFTPYGGFGKSTAEFLSAQMHLGIGTELGNFEKIRQIYKDCSLKSGAEVSGLDLAIQYFGGVTYYEHSSESYSQGPWAYPQYDFILISTGQKVKTHEHIQSLNKPMLASLNPLCEQVIASYFKKNIQEFVAGLKAWSELLESSGFLSAESKNLKTKLEKNRDILCVKPCGAMGADVILVLCELEKSLSVQKSFQNLKLKVQATSLDLMDGVQSGLALSEVLENSRPYVG